jgi:cell division protein FtsW (lipid II flippase)
MPSVVTAAAFIVIFLLCAAAGFVVRKAAPSAVLASNITQWAAGYPEKSAAAVSDVPRLRVMAAAGGEVGLGLYNGQFRRINVTPAEGYAFGVVFEELGMRGGILIIIMLLVVAYGFYFEGMRALRLKPAIACFVVALATAFCTMAQVAVSTGVYVGVGWLKIGLPAVKLPMPFIACGVLSLVLSFICLLIPETIKCHENRRWPE